MKILQVTNFFKPSWEAGGPPRVVYEISKKLLDRGHEITVYTTDGFKYRLDVEKNKPVNVEGIRVYYFRNLSNYLTRKMILPIPYYVPIVAGKEIKDFDIIHIHEYRTFLAVITRYYAKKYGVPYVLQPRGSLPLIAKGKQKKIFDALFGKAIIEDASKIIASSKSEFSQYKNVYPDLEKGKVTLIPNGIRLEDYQNLPKRGDFRKRYSIPEDKKIILYLGRIHRRKGAGILVEAFSKLVNEARSAKLIIAGPDEGFLKDLRQSVQDLNVKEDVIFPGPLYGRDKLGAYIDADVFVLPSKDRYESFGNVALEACVCGTPTIVTNVCGVTEWLNSIEVVEPTSNALYKKLLEVLNKTEIERTEIGKKVREEAKNLSWEKIVEEIERVYQGVLESE